MKSKSFVLLVAVLALFVAACAVGTESDAGKAPDAGSVAQDPEPDPKVPGDDDTTSGGFTVSGGLTITEALAYDGDEVVAVQGFVFIGEQTAALCEVLAESFPPQCGGAMLTLTNPEATSDLVLIEEGGVQWSNAYVTVFGRISDGALTIDTTVSG